MRDILSDLESWQREGKSIALATVIQTWGSAPRRAGAKMALTSDGNIAGSVSGGCVENAVLEAGIDSLKTDQSRLLHFGVADETAWEVGLACGGSIDIFVKPLDAKMVRALRSTLSEEVPAVLITIIQGPQGLLGRELLLREDGTVTGTLNSDLDERALELAGESLSQGTSRRAMLGAEIEIFLEAIPPSPALIIVGGVHIAIALASLAKTLDYRVMMIDPRKAWGNEERFPDVDELIHEWPQQAFEHVRVTRSTAVVMLTHDPKLDDPAVKIALLSPAFYVGALGSRNTNIKRRERLLKEGLGAVELSRLHAPIGLDIGAESPEEIALAIMAEVVNTYRRQNQSEVKVEAIPHPIK
jgi:xanthine dehydrogenase accessory factor